MPVPVSFNIICKWYGKKKCEHFFLRKTSKKEYNNSVIIKFKEKKKILLWKRDSNTLHKKVKILKLKKNIKKVFFLPFIVEQNKKPAASRKKMNALLVLYYEYDLQYYRFEWVKAIFLLSFCVYEADRIQSCANFEEWSYSFSYTHSNSFAFVVFLHHYCSAYIYARHNLVWEFSAKFKAIQNSVHTTHAYTPAKKWLHTPF